MEWWILAEVSAQKRSNKMFCSLKAISKFSRLITACCQYNVIHIWLTFFHSLSFCIGVCKKKTCSWTGIAEDNYYWLFQLMIKVVAVWTFKSSLRCYGLFALYSYYEETSHSRLHHRETHFQQASRIPFFCVNLYSITSVNTTCFFFNWTVYSEGQWNIHLSRLWQSAVGIFYCKFEENVAQYRPFDG